MWEYKKRIISIEDPSDYEIVSEMNKLGQDRWEIFSMTEKVIESWERFGESHKIVEYEMYMKRLTDY